MDPQAVLSKVTRRIVPYLFACYILNYLDRFNVAFAALQMKDDLGFSDEVYGLGVGIFFLGYVLFEVPSNLVLDRVGARRWIARIMVTWGLVSSAMMFVKSPFSFYLLRFLLGTAEAGFFPGIIYYISRWIPARERARAFALFLTSTALAGAFGGGLSALFLKMGGPAGLKGWQWLFLVEGVPTVVLGLATFFYLTDSPEEARWLRPEERRWLVGEIRSENRAKQRRHPFTLAEALGDPRVLRLCLLYFSIVISFYGVSFWLPQIVKNFSGLDNVKVSILSAVPWLCASVGMVAVARHSDRRGEKRRHVALCSAAAGFSLLAGTLCQAHHPYLAFLALCVTATGIWSTLGPFWGFPTDFLSGTAAAGGIALINSVGNVGGFVGPTLVGFVKETTHHFESGMLVLALTLFLAAYLALSLKEEPALPNKPKFR